MHGLEGWSTRQLNDEVPTSFSVVYRLVGDREALSAAVADRVAARVANPGPDVPWRPWLTEVFLGVRAVCLEYPGLAQFFLTRGVVPSIMPILGTGMEVMQRAGFGDEAANAYSFVFTATASLTALSDARRPLPGKSQPALTLTAMAERLGALASSDDRIQAMRDLVAALSDDGEQASFEYALERALDGVEGRIDKSQG